MTQLQIFRVRIFESELFPLKTTRQALLAQAISERPSIEPSKDTKLKVSSWHIGNIVEIDESAYAFAVGRQTPARVSKFDPETGDFYLSEDEDAPFSIAFLETRLGILAISSKPALAKNNTVSDRISQLLLRTKAIGQAGVRISIGPIYDSEAFLTIIKSAFQVKRFIFDFYPPNPSDPEMEIQKVAEEWAQRTNANHGRMSIDGKDLAKDEIDRVARGVISSGSEAIGVIQSTERSTKVRRVSSKTQIVGTEIETLSLESVKSLRQGIESVREVYSTNRGEI